MHIASGDLWAGAEVQTYLLTTELAKLPDVEVQVALMNDGELAHRLRNEGVAVEIFDERRLGAPAIVRGLRRLMTHFGAEIIHTHRTKENVLGLVANVLSVRVPMIRTVHGANEHPAGWDKPLKWLIQSADEFAGRHFTRHLVAVSEALGESLRQRGFDNIAVIPNGIDVDRVMREQVPAPFLVKDGTRHIGLVGRLEPVKRGDLFLEMAAALRASNPPFPLLFHLFGDGSRRSELQQLAARIGLLDNVVFHGHVPEIVTWLGNLDALVLCSDHEGLPMILLEAIAAGVPVVAHAVGGITEVLRDEIGGILVTCQAPTAYADAVMSVLKGERRINTVAARERLRRLYSARRMAETTATLYRSCIHQSES
jgi:glycosyltransferase involved in cell wall biosynthesis